MQHKVASTALYLGIYVTLLVLTFTTLGVAYVPLGEWHVPVALAIAIFKAALVVLFFMHLLHSSKLTWLVVMSGLGIFCILVAFTLSDYWTRSWMPQRTGPTLATPAVIGK